MEGRPLVRCQGAKVPKGSVSDQSKEVISEPSPGGGPALCDGLPISRLGPP